MEIVEQQTCPVCGEHGSPTSVVGVDRWFATPGSWPIVRCGSPRCDSRWLPRRPSDREIAGLYANYHTHTSSSSGGRWYWPHPLAAQAVKNRERNLVPATLAPGRVLEIGCGDGKNLLQLQRRGWDVVGQEIDGVAGQRAAKLLGRPVHIGNLDECGLEDSRFDLVLTSHVLEHVPSPSLLARFAFSVLRPGGLFVNYTPNANAQMFRVLGARWRALEPPRHLVLLGPKSAELVLADAGFRDVEVSTIGAGGGWVYADSVAPTGRGLRRAALTFFGQLGEDVAPLWGKHRHWELRVVGRRPSDS